MLAIIAPGQGSQTPGFLIPWLEDASRKELLATWSEAIGLDLLRLGTEAGADEIRSTENAQPLIVAAGILGAHALGSVTPDLTAGHSVGEITAAAIAHVLAEEDALALVRERGIAMALAASQSKTGMSAVLGGERDVVLAAIRSYGLVAANENGAGQIVAAGELTDLEALAATPPEGARIRPLAVAGAFHTEAMRGAVPHMANFASRISFSDPTTTILSNRDGSAISSGREVIDRIVNQIAHPVRWDLCMEYMKKIGITAVIELPPAGTLVGLIKRALPDVETLALKSPADIEPAKDLITRHHKNSEKVAG